MFPSGSNRTRSTNFLKIFEHFHTVKSIAPTFNLAISSTPKSDLAAHLSIPMNVSVNGTIGSGRETFFESYVTTKLRHHPGRRVIFTPLSSDKQNKKILDPGLQSRTHWQTAKVPQVSLRHGCGQIRAAKM